MTWQTKSNGQPVTIKEQTARNLFTGYLQNKAKDTVIRLLNERVDSLVLINREYKIKDSLQRLLDFKVDSLRQMQNKICLEGVAKLNRQLRWQKTRGDILTSTTIVAIAWALVKALK